jgi:hypothetical protein
MDTICSKGNSIRILDGGYHMKIALLTLASMKMGRCAVYLSHKLITRKTHAGSLEAAKVRVRRETRGQVLRNGLDKLEVHKHTSVS